MGPFFSPGEVDLGDPDALLDAIELQLLATGEPYLSFDEVSSLFTAGSGPTQIAMGDAFAHAQARATQGGALYPFAFDGSGLGLTTTGIWQLYAFLLLVSFGKVPFREAKDWKRSDPIFDAIVANAFRTRYARAIQFGWPPKGDRPTTFPEALDWAATAMGLALRSTHVELPTHRQDGGVDIIAWTPYTDGASGFPVVLVQNTIMREFVGKPAEPDPSQWRDWINFGNTPGVGFAVPYVVSRDDPRRPQVVSRVSDFMDRMRIVENLQSQDASAWVEWQNLSNFVATEIAAIVAAESIGGPAPVPSNRPKKTPRAPRVVTEDSN